METIQGRTFAVRNIAMDALVELISEIKAAREAGRTDADLAAARGFQRRAQFYLDFAEAENSTGFHAPQEAARILGAQRECLGLPDGGISSGEPSHAKAVVEALRRHRPSLVLAPWEDDPHPDHRETSLLVRRARFVARLPRYDAKGEPFAPGPVLWYEQKTPFVPDVVVDIGTDLETKRSAIRAFATQFFRTPDDPVRTEVSDPTFHEMLEARSRVHGARIGAVWGEGFKREGPQPVTDPLQLLSGRSVPGTNEEGR